VSGAVGGLHSKGAVGPAMIVGQVVAENALGMLLVPDDDVVEAVPAQDTDHPLAERIGRWRPRWCGEELGAQSSDAAVEVGSIDGVSVVDEESRNLLGIAGRVDDALGGPAGGWMLGDTGVDNGASAKRENDEDVEESESRGDKDDEVTGPGFVQVVADERCPALATLSVEIGGAVLRDGPRGDLVAELGQFGGDDLLTPGRVLAPHPPDETAEICIDGRTARRRAGAPAPEKAPGGTVPADDRLGCHEQDGVQKVVEASSRRADEPAIESAQARAFDLASDNDELLAKEQVLGDLGCARHDEGQNVRFTRQATRRRPNSKSGRGARSRRSIASVRVCRSPVSSGGDLTIERYLGSKVARSALGGSRKRFNAIAERGLDPANAEPRPSASRSSLLRT
jgi:hypothetical protein